jgi:hypothetical protein
MLKGDVKNTLPGLFPAMSYKVLKIRFFRERSGEIFSSSFDIFI